MIMMHYVGIGIMAFKLKYIPSFFLSLKVISSRQINTSYCNRLLLDQITITTTTTTKELYDTNTDSTVIFGIVAQ